MVERAVMMAVVRCVYRRREWESARPSPSSPIPPTHLQQPLKGRPRPLQNGGKDQLGLKVAHGLKRRLRVGNGEGIAREHGEQGDGAHRLDKLVTDGGGETPCEGRLAVGALFLLWATGFEGSANCAEWSKMSESYLLTLVILPRDVLQESTLCSE